MEHKSIYERWFGIKPIIPFGYPWMTDTGGARLSEEVVEAMAEAANYKIDMTDLLLKAGETVARMLGSESAFITSGGCATLTLAAASVMTGKDISKMEQLPDTEYPNRLKNELIVQVGMFNEFVTCFRVSGAKLIWVGGNEFDFYTEFDPKANIIKLKGPKNISCGEIEEAISDRTAGLVAAIHCSPSVSPPYTLQATEAIEIAKRYNIPVIVDASHLPAAGGKIARAFLRRYLEMGVDLVCMCGGKAIEGPNDTGIIYGRRDLVEAAAAQGAPGIPIKSGYDDSSLHSRALVGRGFKVSKEQIIGLVAALKRYIEMDDEAVTERDNKICRWMADQFRDLPYVKAVAVIPENDWPNDNMIEGGPSCMIEIDEKSLGFQLEDLPKLISMDDSTFIDISSCLCLARWGRLQLFSHGLKDGEEERVVRTLKKVLVAR